MILLIGKGSVSKSISCLSFHAFASGDLLRYTTGVVAT